MRPLQISGAPASGLKIEFLSDSPSAIGLRVLCRAFSLALLSFGGFESPALQRFKTPMPGRSGVVRVWRRIDSLHEVLAPSVSDRSALITPIC